MFTPGGAAPPVVSLPFGRVAAVICYDLEFPEWARLPALDGADLITAPDGYPLAGPVLADRAAVLLTDCDLARARDKRLNDHNDLFADRRPELY